MPFQIVGTKLDTSRTMTVPERATVQLLPPEKKLGLQQTFLELGDPFHFTWRYPLPRYVMPITILLGPEDTCPTPPTFWDRLMSEEDDP